MRAARREPLLALGVADRRFGFPLEVVLRADQGMMDTVLNLGLNDESVKGLAKQTQQRALRVRLVPPLRADVRQDRARRSRRPVRGGAARPRREKGLSVDTELERRRPRRSRRDVQGRSSASEAGVEFPTDPHEQLALRDRGGVQVVERQARAATTAGWRGIADDLGTAVNVQTMVFGNKGDDSGTGVAFTRNPSTGESKPYGDFLENAQGEDVVAGIRITEPLDAMGNDFPEPHQAAARGDEAAREPLPRHVRHRVHDRAGSPVHAADARRQAHGRGRVAHGGRDGRRGPHRQDAKRCCACSPRSSTSCCTRSSTRRPSSRCSRRA